MEALKAELIILNAVHFSQNLELEMIQRDTKKTLTHNFCIFQRKGRSQLKSWNLLEAEESLPYGGIVIAVFSLLEESEVVTSQVPVLWTRIFPGFKGIPMERAPWRCVSRRERNRGFQRLNSGWFLILPMLVGYGRFRARITHTRVGECNLLHLFFERRLWGWERQMWHHGSWLSKASLCASEIVQHLVTWKFTMIGIKSQQISYILVQKMVFFMRG